MVDLKLQQPVTEEVEVDSETATAIQRGIKAAQEGRTISAEEVRKLIPVDFQILYTDPALADLEEILFYSWSKFPGAAESFGIALLNHVDLLRAFPYIGSPVTGLAGVRRLVHTPILIYYRVAEDDKVVEVLHFWHAAREQPGI